MTPAELLTLPFSGQTVAIIGNPATGKTWLSNELVRRTGAVKMPMFFPIDKPTKNFVE